MYVILKEYITRGKNEYFVTFIDNYSKYYYIYLFKSKDERVLQNLFHIKLNLQKTIEILRSNKGREYTGDFGKFCVNSYTIHEVTPPYSPQSNDVVVTENRAGIAFLEGALINRSTKARVENRKKDFAARHLA